MKYKPTNKDYKIYGVLYAEVQQKAFDQWKSTNKT